MSLEIQNKDKFQYVEHGRGDKTILLLHGLFGALSNFKELIHHFSADYHVVIPILPIYSSGLFKSTINNLVDYVFDFVKMQEYDDLILVGNSLGGHIGLLFTLKHPELVGGMVLTGSSGLFENALGTTYPKRGDYDYIREKTETTFYDKKMASKELVDELFEIVNDRMRVVRILSMAKSAIRNNLGDNLHEIKIPVLLIWGNNDIITPPFVGEAFHKELENSTLYFIDQCGHAPMMEHPGTFNELMTKWLSQTFEPIKE